MIQGSISRAAASILSTSGCELTNARPKRAISPKRNMKRFIFYIAVIGISEETFGPSDASFSQLARPNQDVQGV